MPASSCVGVYERERAIITRVARSMTRPNVSSLPKSHNLRAHAHPNNMHACATCASRVHARTHHIILQREMSVRFLVVVVAASPPASCTRAKSTHKTHQEELRCTCDACTRTLTRQRWRRRRPPPTPQHYAAAAAATAGVRVPRVVSNGVCVCVCVFHIRGGGGGGGDDNNTHTHSGAQAIRTHI